MELTVTRDRERLAELETIIDRTQQSFIECGCALREIQVDRLYEKVRGVASFETYIKDRFGMARRTAYQLIDASKVIDNVRHGAQIEVLPSTERQARPLTRLKDDPEKQREAWAKAVETAPEGKVTAAHVQKVVRGFTGESGQTEDDVVYPHELWPIQRLWRRMKRPLKLAFLDWVNEHPPRRSKSSSGEIKVEFTDALLIATFVISHLERIQKDDPAHDEALAQVADWIAKKEHEDWQIAKNAKRSNP